MERDSPPPHKHVTTLTNKSCDKVQTCNAKSNQNKFLKKSSGVAGEQARRAGAVASDNINTVAQNKLTRRRK